jgi:hypothetical protein
MFAEKAYASMIDRDAQTVNFRRSGHEIKSIMISSLPL